MLKRSASNGFIEWKRQAVLNRVISGSILVSALFFFALRHSSPADDQISVPLVDVKLSASAVLASGGTVLAFLVLAAIGSIRAWSTALKEYAGNSWRDAAERLDTHPNALDLAIYTLPDSSHPVGKVVYFVYPLYLTGILVEAAWLQFWLWSTPAPGRWFFIVAWVLLWPAAAWLLIDIWRQRIERLRSVPKAG